jgi:hypothetical protein
MNNDLLSLSLTDMKFNENSVATTEIIKMLVQTGGEFEYNNTTNLIIAIAFISIATIIFIGENNWITINTNIDYLNCNAGGCVLGLDYQINGTTYKKEFNVSQDFARPSNNQVTITYDTSNPNNSYMGSSNYNILIYSLYGLGIFFMCIWYYLSSDKNSSSYEPSVSFYSKSEIPSEIYSQVK